MGSQKTAQVFKLAFRLRKAMTGHEASDTRLFLCKVEKAESGQVMMLGDIQNSMEPNQQHRQVALCIMYEHLVELARNQTN